MYQGAFVVVTSKGGSIGQYTVTRYWKNRFTNWVESEHLFDILGGPYSNLFLFDGYAIAVKDDQVVQAIWFDQFRGKPVPQGLMVDLLAEFDGTDSTFEKITFWDMTGSGNYAMLAAVRTPGAVTL